MTPRKRLRQLLAQPGIIPTTGVFDALSARISEQAGFPAVFMSGYCVEATYANPDLGLLSMREVAERAESVANSISIPVIADADNGYGNALNVIRTVQALERAGCAALELEDQALPKKCGALDDMNLVSVAEMVGKIKAAVDARKDPDFLIVARTDANRTFGLDHALERALAYEEAGADISFVQMPRSEAELERIFKTCKKPTMLTISENRRMPILPLKRLEAMGLKIGVFPLSLLFASIGAMQRAARRLLEDGGFEGACHEFATWQEVNQLVDMDGFLSRSEHYGSKL